MKVIVREALENRDLSYEELREILELVLKLIFKLGDKEGARRMRESIAIYPDIESMGR